MNHELVLDIILALIFLVGLVFQNVVKKNQTAKTFVDLVNQLAPQAVVMAEKSGLTENLKGSDKFKKAVDYVNQSIKSLGLTASDQTAIKNAVEKAWADLSVDGTLESYKKEGNDETKEVTVNGFTK
ncbi:phage holin [Lactobacillus gigeriorum]|uniref:Putative holin n=1 Tax=Lactobacillus gigeriorum DSM 23908 = CRBIP 24.85 TaxID=1423751 RepID=I7KP40_9LACO|nr:phage holin [Lactobacillus gigeriorum]KRN12806.1 hypothetical protein FC38_GL000281 [Lactobacillus gigeriorum DSM 23908 = CRBIP 24.85]CCI87104.1 Putative holin [Lactobacillus gigeriorum DSM 23908 = CRBIP 24.85]